MRYRIAIGGIHIESSTFTPYRSAEVDFTVKRGRELLDYYPFLEQFSAQVDFVPLTIARALPGGIVSRDFYNRWQNDFFDLLKAAQAEATIDGILLDIHGAMSVIGSVDAEGDFATALRKALGKQPLISATMDLHGNVSDKLFNACDLITCYRTAPHVDVQATKQRALTNLLNALSDKATLWRAKVDVPILLSGEKTSTEVQPGKALYRSLESVCQLDGIIDAALFMGFPWADQARCHGAVVVSGTMPAVVEQQAAKLAENFWRLRRVFDFVGPTAKLDSAIETALQSKEKPFFISDTGDNPGAGGAGDLNIVLRAFIEHNQTKKLLKKVLFASFFDPLTIDLLYQKELAESVDIALGGKVAPVFGAPLALNVKIERYFTDRQAGRCALVSIDNIYIIVTEKRFQYGSWAAFTRAGLNDFSDYDIIVVKMGYLEPDLNAAAGDWVMALTAGPVNQDIVNVEYHHLKRPLFPFDKDFKAQLTVNLVKR